MTKRKGKWKQWVGAQTGYRPNEIAYEATDEELTVTGGLGPILDLFLESPLFAEFSQCLPKRVSNNSYPTESFALMLLAGFLVGFDCLDDLEHFQYNPLIVQRFGKVPTPKAFGDWLRDFELEEVMRLKEFLRHHAQFSRKKIDPQASLKIDMDSTTHIQHATQMEGLDFDYKGNWGLSSLSVRTQWSPSLKTFRIGTNFF